MSVKYPVVMTFQGQLVAVVHDEESILTAANDHFDDQNYAISKIEWFNSAWTGQVAMTNGDLFDIEHVAIYSKEAV